MKSSFMVEGDLAKPGKPEPLQPDSSHYKRAPRMSEQPNLKLSTFEFGAETKVPSFLQDKCEKRDKKVPYVNDGERPKSEQ
jgi:hypothetical protein